MTVIEINKGYIVNLDGVYTVNLNQGSSVEITDGYTIQINNAKGNEGLPAPQRQFTIISFFYVSATESITHNIERNDIGLIVVGNMTYDFIDKYILIRFLQQLNPNEYIINANFVSNSIELTLNPIHYLTGANRRIYFNNSPISNLVDETGITPSQYLIIEKI